MPASKKAIKQRQKAGLIVTQIKKTLKKIGKDSSDKHKYNDYDTNQL